VAAASARQVESKSPRSAFASGTQCIDVYAVWLGGGGRRSWGACSAGGRAAPSAPRLPGLRPAHPTSRSEVAASSSSSAWLYPARTKDEPGRRLGLRRDAPAGSILSNSARYCRGSMCPLGRRMIGTDQLILMGPPQQPGCSPRPYFPECRARVQCPERPLPGPGKRAHRRAYKRDDGRRLPEAPAHSVHGRGAGAPALWSAACAVHVTRHTERAFSAGVYLVLFGGTVWVLRARRQGSEGRSIGPVIDLCSWFIFITLTVVSPSLSS
jgi:hypothetical protein